MLKKLFLILLFTVFFSPLVKADLQLALWKKGAESVAHYSKYSAEFASTGVAFINPYNSREIALDAVFTAPNGSEIMLPLYYQSSAHGKTLWGLNFTPRQQGHYQYYVKAKYRDKILKSAVIKFDVQPSKNPGFLHSDNNLGSWVYDNGERFRGVGLNIAWEARLSIGDDPKYDYQYLFAEMKKNNVNLVRTWINAPWNIPLEWHKPNFGRYKEYSGLGLHPEAIARFDYLIKHADKNAVNLMLTMDYHGSLWARDFDNWGNDHWKNHPYNVKNGGPAKTPEEFFTHPQAISRYQDRLRYIIARWGYSTRIAAIEFWNEIDNAVHKDGQNISEQSVTTWHQIMVDYLSEIDPYQHIKTTSISHQEIEGLFDVKGLDFTQTHLYGRTSVEMEAYLKDFSLRYNKAYVVGETAVGWDGVNDKIDDYALALHEQLWVFMFSKTPLLPMTWWWEAYDKNNKFFHLKHVASFIAELTDTDDLYSSKNQVTVTNGAMHRSLYKGSSQYVWVKNTAKQSKDIKVTITSSLDNLLIGDYKVSLYDTWTGKTSQLAPVAVISSQVSINIKALAGERDVVVILTKN